MGNVQLQIALVAGIAKTDPILRQCVVGVLEKEVVSILQHKAVTLFLLYPNVLVRNISRNSTDIFLIFTALISVEPNRAHINGNISVTVTLSLLVQPYGVGYQCDFGGIPVNAQMISEFELICEAPASSK